MREFSNVLSKQGYFTKAAKYVRRAFIAKDVDDHETFQFWMSLSLELLGKGVLSSVNPALIINATDRRSIMASLGFGETHHIQTIGAGETFTRLSNIVPRYNARLAEYCQLTAARRNEELHSAAQPFGNRDFDKTEHSFWHSIEILLDFADLDIHSWLGDDPGERTAGLIQDIHRAEEMSAVSAVIGCKENWAKLSNKVKSDKQEFFRGLDEHQKFFCIQDASGYRIDKNSECECPACGNPMIIGGLKVDEKSELKDEYYDDEAEDDIMVFETWGLYHSDIVKCIHCDLIVKNAHCLRKLGIRTSFEKTSQFVISEEEAQARRDQDMVDMMGD